MTENTLTVKFPPEMKERIEQNVNGENEEDDGAYSSQSEYVRKMVLAGESHVATLDPRTNNQDQNEGSKQSEDVEEAARSLTDAVLLHRLTENPQNIKEILEQPTHEFQSVLANQLDQLARDSASPVERDPLEEGYYIDMGDNS
jgi:Arc/MetJ-type ribon-helix-helix transcriptional regulator